MRAMEPRLQYDTSRVTIHRPSVTVTKMRIDGTVTERIEHEWNRNGGTEECE